MDNEIISSALDLACCCQNIHRLDTGKRVLKALLGAGNTQYDKDNILEIERLSYKYVADAYEYQRLLELLEYLNLEAVVGKFISLGFKSSNEEIVEVARQFIIG